MNRPDRRRCFRFSIATPCGRISFGRTYTEQNLQPDDGRNRKQEHDRTESKLQPRGSCCAPRAVGAARRRAQWRRRRSRVAREVAREVVVREVVVRGVVWERCAAAHVCAWRRAHGTSNAAGETRAVDPSISTARVHPLRRASRRRSVHVRTSRIHRGNRCGRRTGRWA